MKILFIGDVFGNCGRRVLAEHLPSILSEFKIEMCIVNGENAAGGRGVTANLAKKFQRYGVHVVTGGNHSLGSADARDALDEMHCLLRPLNLPPGNSGMGQLIHELPDGRKVGVLNLQGRTFFNETLDCPFRIGRRAAQELRQETPIVIVDFHAEATSEKVVLGHYLDGRVSALIGTHTHVQTADERILPKGTAYITDAGMTGPEQSAIGMKTSLVLQRFLLQSPVRFEPADSGPMINGVVLDIDDTTGEALSIKRLYRRVHE